MKVKTWVEVEQEIEVEVSIADMMNAIRCLKSSDRPPFILSAVSTAFGCIHSVTDAEIAAMGDRQRKIIGEALRDESARYFLSAPEARAEGQSTTGSNADPSSGQGDSRGESETNLPSPPNMESN